MLESLITSKTRLRLLVKFFLNIANKGYLNSLANEFGESTNSVRKELNNLSSAGYLEKYNENNRVIYKANVSHPLFKIIQKVFINFITLIRFRVASSSDGLWEDLVANDCMRILKQEFQKGSQEHS